MSTRCCPSCSRRWTMLVDPYCPICDGVGILVLGRAAEARFGAEVASRSVEYALEAQARRDLDSPHANVDAARRHLRATVEQLRSNRVLARHGDTPHPPNPRRPATVGLAHLEAKAATAGYEAGDARNLDRPALEYRPDDRPLAAGGIPGFSLGLYVCNLARAADPFDPLTNSVRDVVTGRYVSARKAQTLAETIPLFDGAEQ